MKKFKYAPEALCLLLFLACSLMWVESIRHHETLTKQLNALLLLESSIPQHQIQLLNVNFSDQLHYDNFSQLQSQIESTILTLSNDSELKNLLSDYVKTSSHYIQLVTMLKTSQRLVSKNEPTPNGMLSALMDSLHSQLLSFITLPNSITKNRIYALIASPELNNNDAVYQQYWQLYKLHTIFIIDNLEKTADYRHQLINLPVIDKTITSIMNKNKQIKAVQTDKVLGGVGSLLSILFIFMIILKRQQYALRETS
jgi:hypothetical protein